MTDNYALKLKSFIDKNKVKCTQLLFKEDVSTSEACTKLGITLDNIVKTIIMFNERKELLALVLRGDHRIDRKPLRQKYNCKDFRLATAEEILEKTGYPLGGVPPFGFTAEWVIDERVMKEQEKEFYAGGGSIFALVQMTPQEMVRTTKGKVMAFSIPLS